MKITQGSKVRIKSKKVRGVSFKVLVINQHRVATIVNSVSGLSYQYNVADLECV